MQESISAKDFYLMTKVNRVIIPFAAFLAGIIFSGIFELQLILLAFLSIIFTYSAAATLNDIFDTNIDMITNSNRPLPQRKLEQSGALLFVGIFALIGILTSFYVSTTYGKPLFVWIAIAEFILGVLYSAVMSKNFLTANGTLAITHGVIPFITAAYLMSLSIDNTMLVFAGVIWVLLFLTYNLKDLKDARGDLYERKTLPVIFGVEHAKKMNVFLLCSALPIGAVGSFITKRSVYSMILTIVFGLALVALSAQLSKSNNNYEKTLGKFRILMGLLIISMAF